MTDSSSIEIMFSYLILVGFIIVIFTLTGQTLFGSNFPTNPIGDISFNFIMTCEEGNFLCQASTMLTYGLSLLAIPFLFLNYVFQMMIFFFTSPTLWWLGLILFFPAGVVFIYLLIPIIQGILDILAKILHAIAEAIPF